MTHRRDCIVIGAGAAGLSAALTLHEAGRDVVVLEARDRLGGRAYSARLSDGTVVEHGAQFVHGPTVATWDFLNRLGLKTHYMVVGSKRPYTVHRDGDWHDSDPFVEEAWDHLEGILDRPNSDDLSLRDVLASAGLQGRILQAAENALCVAAPMPPDDVSARNASDIHHAYDSIVDPISGVTRPGNPNFFIVDGYSKLWDEISHPFMDSIHLGTPVTGIDWPDEGVIVHTAERSYTAKTCMITLPIGVLHEKNIEFRPRLPYGKLNAIDKIDGGGLIKIVTEFDSRWWKDSVGDVPNFKNGAPTPFVNGFMDPFWGRPGPPALVCFIGTPWVRRLTGDGERIRSMYLEALGEIFPNEDIESQIISFHIADWASDPLTMGGISVVPAGGHQLRADLAAPTPPLFWAGEASHTRGPRRDRSRCPRNWPPCRHRGAARYQTDVLN